MPWRKGDHKGHVSACLCAQSWCVKLTNLNGQALSTCDVYVASLHSARRHTLDLSKPVKSHNIICRDQILFRLKSILGIYKAASLSSACNFTRKMANGPTSGRHYGEQLQKIPSYLHAATLNHLNKEHRQANTKSQRARLLCDKSLMNSWNQFIGFLSHSR